MLEQIFYLLFIVTDYLYIIYGLFTNDMIYSILIIISNVRFTIYPTTINEFSSDEQPPNKLDSSLNASTKFDFSIGCLLL